MTRCSSFLVAALLLAGCADRPSAPVAETSQAVEPGNGFWTQELLTEMAGGAGSVAMFADNDFVLAGRVSESWVYNEQPPDGEQIETDIAVLRHDAEGDLVWARTYHGPDQEYTAGVAVDSDGEILLAGYGATDFGCGTTPTDGPFLVKLDPDDGSCIWLRHPADGVAAVAVRGTEIVTAGTYTPDVPPTHQAVAVSRYAGDGTLRWARRFGDGQLFVSGVGLTDNGRVVVGGRISHPIDFGDGAVGDADGGAFVLSRDAAGDHEIARAWSSGEVRSLAVNGAGDTVILGDFAGSIGLGGRIYTAPGDRVDLFMVKLSPTLHDLWYRRPFGSALAHPGQVFMEPSGFVVATAVFSDGTVTVPPHSFTATGYRLLVARFGTNTGNVVWASASGDEAGAAWIDPHGLAVSPDRQRVIVAGMYGGLLDFHDEGSLYYPDGFHTFFASLQR